MNDDLVAALAPVLRDVRATGAPEPRLVEDDPTRDGLTSIWLTAPDGSATGLSLEFGDSDQDRIARISEVVQEWVIEQRWRRGTNWPSCPVHPTSHPLEVRRRRDEVWWWCPRGGGPVARIGSLPVDTDGRAG